MSFRNPRLWSGKAKASSFAVTLTLWVAAALLLAHISHNPWPQSIAAALAIASLIATALSAHAAFARTRRKDTLDAYSAWSDKTHIMRRELTQILGTHTLGVDQAHALVGKTTLTDVNGQEVLPGEKQQVRDNLCDVLNGLERLATGVNHGIYDEKVLRTIGGTLISLVWQRYKPYVDARQSAIAAAGQQSKAYEQLAVLVHSLDIARFDAGRKGMRDAIDAKRLEANR